MEISTIALATYVLYFMVFLFVAVFVFLYLLDHTRRKKKINNVPTMCGWPFLGSTLIVHKMTSEGLFQATVAVAASLPRGEFASGTKIGFRYFYGIQRAKGAEAVLSSSKIIDKGKEYDFLHPWLGQGLLTNGGKKWFERRKMLTPSFHFKILGDFMGVFNEQSAVLVEKLQDQVNKPGFNLMTYVSLCTLDIICETAMGRKVHAQSNKDCDYVKAIYRMLSIIQHRQLRPWLHPNFVFKRTRYGKEHEKCLDILHGFTFKVIEERKKQRTIGQNDTLIASQQDGSDGVYSGEKRHLAFLDLLLDCADKNCLTDNDIREEVDTFMFEGHDTTAVATCWCLYLLGTSPTHQARVHEEMNELFGSSDRPVTLGDLGEMRYLDLCIKEALRLFPSVPGIARAVKADISIGDCVFPAGSTLIISPYCIQRDPAMYPNPEVFNPDNFLPENVEKRHAFAFLPFSAGYRNCIGQKFAAMEEKVLLSMILRRFCVKSLTPREDLVLQGDIILRPTSGFNVSLTLRE